MQSEQIKTFVFMGRSGSGKGTQAKLLSDTTGFAVFSSGEKFRELRAQPGVLGTRVREAYDTAQLLPAWFAEYLFEDALLKLAPDAGIIFEGTGRWREEAERFHEVAGWLGRAYRVLYLDIGEEEGRERQTKRALVQHRPDSNTAEKIKIRFDEYNAHTADALAYFRAQGVVIDIPAEGAIDAIHQDIMLKLGTAPSTG
jgi:adenylate kinase